MSLSGFPHGDWPKEASVRGVLLRVGYLTWYPSEGYMQYSASVAFFQNPDGSLYGKLVDAFGTAGLEGRLSADVLSLRTHHQATTPEGDSLHLEGAEFTFMFTQKTRMGWEGEHTLVRREGSLASKGKATCTIATTDLTESAFQNSKGM